MVSKFQKFCEENGILMGIIVVILTTVLVLSFPLFAYGIGYLSGTVCDTMFRSLFPFENVPETFGLVSALGCVFSMGRITNNISD